MDRIPVISEFSWTGSQSFHSREFYQLLLARIDTTGSDRLPPTVAFMLRDGSIKFSESAPIFRQLEVLEESRLSDRLLVVITVAYLEDQIRLLLKKFLLEHDVTDELFDPNTNQLASLLTMAKLAFSLGLIPKEWFEILKRMANLRNMFAHIPEASSFENLINHEKRTAGILQSLLSRYKELTQEELSEKWHDNFSELFRFMYTMMQYAIDHIASAKPVQPFHADEITGVNYLMGLTRESIQVMIDNNFGQGQ